MEPFAAKTCLQALISRGMIIASFTTDRCSAISSMMLSDPVLAKICHEYDVWHWISKYFALRHILLSAHCALHK